LTLLPFAIALFAYKGSLQSPRFLLIPTLLSVIFALHDLNFRRVGIFKNGFYIQLVVILTFISVLPMKSPLVLADSGFRWQNFSLSAPLYTRLTKNSIETEMKGLTKLVFEPCLRSKSPTNLYIFSTTWRESNLLNRIAIDNEMKYLGKTTVVSGENADVWKRNECDLRVVNYEKGPSFKNEADLPQKLIGHSEEAKSFLLVSWPEWLNYFDKNQFDVTPLVKDPNTDLFSANLVTVIINKDVS